MALRSVATANRVSRDEPIQPRAELKPRPFLQMFSRAFPNSFLIYLPVCSLFGPVTA